ncbi:hypothetical protein BD626DRAFT_478709 [Schizophyllum amplum]|uniref:Uncharacterized protein n=1 Tax=Schizophyllum amplum TaxID=97359 RepID=A0A550CRL4_9AGAR|nr:hypothetical protein BD626DRAFT_478709 [Auriculariopsis ampla]
MPKVVSSSKSTKTSKNPEDYLRRPKEVMSRTYITKHIVLLHCKQCWDTDELRLQYRDGTSLPRPNMIGFKLIDCCDKREQAWNGKGDPMVYIAELDRDGAYKLMYEGREVWSCLGRDLGREPRYRPMDTATRAANDAKFERARQYIHESFRHGPVQIHENDIVLRDGSSIHLDNLPANAFLCKAPPGMFTPFDSEDTHQLREYKRRTGRTMCINGARNPPSSRRNGTTTIPTKQLQA